MTFCLLCYACTLPHSHLDSLHQNWLLPQVMKLSFLYTLSHLPKLVCFVSHFIYHRAAITTSLRLKSQPLKHVLRASLVAQWLRICLLMQGTRVRALVWEDPTCHGAAGPLSHNY